MACGQRAARRIRRGGLPAGLAAVLLLAACANEDPVRPGDVPPILSVNQVVQTTGWFPAIAVDSTAYAEARFDSSAVPESLTCKDFVGFQRVAAQRLTILAQRPDRHHPGAILQYGALAAADLLTVDADRAGGQLVLTDVAGAEATGEVAVVDGPSVDAWRREALAGLGAAAPGNWILSVMAVHGNQHLALAAGVGPAAMPAAVRDQLALRDATSGRVLVRLERRHHAVRAVYPGTAGAAFLPTVTGPDVADQMSPGNPPVWVETVAYGELVLVLVEAAAPPVEVFAAVRRSFLAAVGGTAPDAGPLLDELPSLGVRAYAEGADAQSFAAAAAAGVGPLTTALHAAPDSPADLPPVTASLAALRNGGPVDFEIAADFAFVLCEPFSPVFTSVLWSFQAADAQTVNEIGDLDTDAGGTYYYQGGAARFAYRRVTRIPDLLGSGGDAVPLDRRPMVLPTAANGRPAVELFELALPGGVIRSRLRFDGTALIGRDYTLFIVVNPHPFVRLTIATPSGDQILASTNRVNFFLHGTRTSGIEVGVGSARLNLFIGYPDNQRLFYSHSYYQLETNHARQHGWQVFALRYRLRDGERAGGMTAFHNGVQIGHSPWDYSLLDFQNATLCARWVGLSGYSTPDMAGLLLAEIVAYDGAGSDEMVLAEIERLQAKYGL